MSEGTLKTNERQQEILELAKHESSISEGMLVRQLTSPYAMGEDKQAYFDRWAPPLAFAGTSLTFMGLLSALTTFASGYTNLPIAIGLVSVPAGYIATLFGEKIIRDAYSPLVNDDGLRYDELRRRAIADGRLK